MLYNQGHREFKTRRAQEKSGRAEKKKLSQEEKLQAVLYCLEHQLDYRRTSEQYKVTYQQIYYQDHQGTKDKASNTTN